MAFSREEKNWRIAALLQCCVAMIIMSFAVLSCQERTEMQNKPAASFSGKTLLLSKDSQIELINLMHREEMIIAVAAVSASLVTNSRQVTFFESENVPLKNAWEKYMATRTSVPPVFTDNYYLNTRITEVINGTFECRRTKTTMIGRLYPADNFAPFVCSIAVPPAFDDGGDFIGWINIFLKGPISDSERARLAKEAVIVATSIYHRDIKGKL